MVFRGYIAKGEKRLITKAIAYHNAAALPDVNDEKELFYMRLLRDADKLDIWKVVIDYYHNRDRFKSPAIELNLSDDPIWSGKIIDAVVNKKTVHIKDVKTLNDFKLLQISWAFDLNFTPSFQTVEHRKYLHQIEATLPQSPEIEDADVCADVVGNGLRGGDVASVIVPQYSLDDSAFQKHAEKHGYHQ